MFAKSIYTALLAGLVLLTGCSDDKGQKSDEKTLTVATSADYPPFEFFKDGKIVGFDIDMITAVGEKMGRKVVIKDMSFDAILGSLQSNRVDAAVASMTPTEERLKAIDFSNVYLSTGKALVCSDTSSIRSTADLSGAVVGVQAGSTHETYVNEELRKNTDNLEIKSLSKVPDLVQELKSRRISCIVLGTSEAKTLMANHSGMRLVELPTKETGSAIGLPKGSPLLPEINQALEALIKDGTIEKLKQKWQVQ